MPEIPMGNQLYEGRGLNTDTGVVHNVAINYTDLEQYGTAQRVIFVLESISSSRELNQKLRISASASFSAGVGGISAEFSLTNSVEVNQYYTYALMRCHVQNPPKLIRNPTLRDDARNLLVQGGWEAFSTAYGWEYVEGFVEGGSYYGLIEIQTSSEDEQRNVKAKLSGHYGPFKATAEFESDLKDIQKRSAINVSVSRSGGTGGVVNHDIDSMLNEARNFPQTAADHPVRISALTAEYRNSVPMPQVDGYDSLPRQNQRDTLSDLGRMYLRLRDYKASLEFINSHQLTEFDDFLDLDAQSLAAKRAEFKTAAVAVAAEIDSVVTQARRCASDYDGCTPYVPQIDFLPLPRIGGELLTITQLEKKLAAVEDYLRSHGRLGGAAAFDGDVTVGAGGNARLLTRHIDGKQGVNDGPDNLHLNWSSGTAVVVGGGAKSRLDVHGDVVVDDNIVLDPDSTVLGRGRVHIAGEEHLYLLNKTGVTVSAGWQGTGTLAVDDRLGTAGRHPTQGMPEGIHGGLHTWDVVAEGVIGVGPPGEAFRASMWSDGAIRGRTKQFVIDHPLRPDDMQLVHAAIEGPEVAVYYRGQGATGDDGTARIHLPDYFEALTRPDGRTVLVTPLTDGDAATPLAVSTVNDASFVVRCIGTPPAKQAFYWEVKAIRADIDTLATEVRKAASPVSELTAPGTATEPAGAAAPLRLQPPQPDH